ncbi:MAG: carbohydrate ABC transporter substrate-binding protein [Thermomicrobiales bacterium]|nr:carbohydrate ABC transporter substrate-binding protein [Thermomicrobiales bacterium]
MDRLELLRRQEAFIKEASKRKFSRRQIIKAGTALGISAPMLAGLARFAAEPVAAQDGPLTMVGWGYSPEIVEDNVNNFMALYEEDVDYQLTTGGNYHQIVETKFLGGQTPSVVYSESEYMYRWWRAGFVQDVEGIVGPEPTEFYKEEMLPFGVANLSLPNGNLAALPYYSGYNAFIYNQDHLEQAGLEPPTTWEELNEQCRQLQTDGISEHPMLSAQNHEWASLSWSIFAIWYSEGEPVFDENFEPTFADGGVAFQKVIEMHKQWLDEGITPPDIMVHELESTPAWMTGNHTFMVVHDYDQQAFNVGETSNTKGIVGNALIPGSVRDTFSWTACYLLGAQDVDRERAWHLMEYLGGKNKEGNYVGNTRWALEKGLGNPHREVLEDPEVIASWETWRDMDVHVQQLEQSKGRAVEKTMWFPEWNWQMMTEVQEYMSGNREIGEVIDNLVNLVADLKELYPED